MTYWGSQKGPKGPPGSRQQPAASSLLCWQPAGPPGRAREDGDAASDTHVEAENCKLPSVTSARPGPPSRLGQSMAMPLIVTPLPWRKEPTPARRAALSQTSHGGRRQPFFSPFSARLGHAHHPPPASSFGGYGFIRGAHNRYV